MKSNRVKCNPLDYDFYTIPFPFSAIKKTQRNKFLYSELGKLHPCFSDDCCFDSRLRLEKNGIKADVVVMQKYKLAQYKSRGKKIYVEERKAQSFFCKDYRKTYLLFTAVVIVSLFLIILVRIIFVKSAKTDQQNLESVSANYEKTVFSESNDESEMTSCFISTVAELNGKITAFEWKQNDFSYEFSAEVKGIYPENFGMDFQNASFSAVSFQQALPVMKVSLNRKINALGQREPEQAFFLRADFRSLIKTLGGNIFEESIVPYGMNFSLPMNNQELCINAVAQIMDFICANAMSLKSFKLYSNNEEINISMYFSDVRQKYSDIVCDCLRKNVPVFLPEKKNEKPEKIEQKKAGSVVLSTDLASKRKTKIGQVIRDDGSLIEFYKNEQGKIVRME